MHIALIILLSLLAAALIFLIGFILGVILERDACEEEQRRFGGGKFLILSLICLSLALASCLPKIEQPPVVESSCVLEPLAEKPDLPLVEYQKYDGLLCLDEQNQARALDRESLLREDSNMCRATYSKALERCGE